MREIQKNSHAGRTRIERASNAHPAYIPRISYDIPQIPAGTRGSSCATEASSNAPKRIPVTKPNPTDHPGESIVPMGHHVRTHWTGYGAYTLLNGILSQKNLTRACEISRGRTISGVNLTKSRVHLTRISRTSRVHPAYIPRTSRVKCRVHPA